MVGFAVQLGLCEDFGPITVSNATDMWKCSSVQTHVRVVTDSKKRKLHLSYRPLQPLPNHILIHSESPSRRINRQPLPIPQRSLARQVIFLHLRRHLPIIAGLQIQHHNARIPRRDIHPSPINRRVEPPDRIRIEIDPPLHRPALRVHNCDIRVQSIDEVRGVEPGCVRAPAGCALVGHHDVMQLRDLEAGVRDLDDRGAEGGVGDQSAGIGAEEIDAEIDGEGGELVDHGRGSYLTVVDSPGIDVPGHGWRGRRVGLDADEERAGRGVEHDVGGRVQGAHGRSRHVQADWEGAEAAEGGEAFGMVGVEAGDAAFGTPIQDAGGFEGGGVGDGHGELAHGVAGLPDKFGAGRVEWGDAEHGEGVAAGVDGEEVLVGVSEVVGKALAYTHRGK